MVQKLLFITNETEYFIKFKQDNIKRKINLIFIFIFVLTLGFVETLGIAILLPLLDFIINSQDDTFLNLSEYFPYLNILNIKYDLKL